MRAVAGAAMAPEQASGLPADARVDIFSFGRVLQDMMGAATQSHGAGTDTVREALARVVATCLEHDPGRRYASVSDVRRELEWLREPSGTQAALSSPNRHRPALTRRQAGTAMAVLMLALAAGGYAYSHRPRPLTSQDTIVLADFANRTGDPVFDGTLRQGLTIQLQQSPFLALVSEERVRGTLRLMDRRDAGPLTPDVAIEICQRTASTAVVEPSIAGLGSRYVLGLRARQCQTGTVLFEQQAEAASKDDVLAALSRLSADFRAQVGESLSTVQRHGTPLAEATTSSLEALKAYSEAWNVELGHDPAAAVVLLQRALAIDPEFAMAHAFLGRVYGDIAESRLAAESASEGIRTA